MLRSLQHKLAETEGTLLREFDLLLSGPIKFDIHKCSLPRYNFLSIHVLEACYIMTVSANSYVQRPEYDFPVYKVYT